MKTIFRIGKWVVPILIAMVLYKKFFGGNGFSFGHFAEQMRQLPVHWYVLLAFSSFINWSLETVKWRILIKMINPLPFFMALASILSGVAVSQLLPYKTGEYLGRLVHIKDENKLNAALLSMVGSYSQFLITVFAGIIGWMVVQPLPLSGIFIWSFPVFMITGFVIYYLLPGFKFRIHSEVFRKLQSALSLITKKELTVILGLSLIRYCTFLLPYSLLAWHYGLNSDAPLMFHIFAVSCIFLMQTIAPNFILTDIALRLTIPVIVFSNGNLNISSMDYVPGMVIYVFNVAIPMIIGAILILFSRYRQV